MNSTIMRQICVGTLFAEPNNCKFLR